MSFLEKIQNRFGKIQLFNDLKSLDLVDILKESITSIVVFLVALPLCLGIAIASGVPPIYGIITGVIGGIVAGILSGCPLQITGPAGGLIVITLEIVQKFGFENLGMAVFIAGILQIFMGFIGLAPWLQIVSPAIIVGMLSGIGLIIFASQFLVMLSVESTGTTIDNLFTIPGILFKTIFPENESTYHIAAGVGLITLLSIFFWKLLPFHKAKFIPPTLFAVFFASIVANFLDLPIDYVSIPSNALSQIKFFDFMSSVDQLNNSDFFIAVCALTFIASVEAILTSKVIDNMCIDQTTEYNREIVAQGIGNTIAGTLNSLPLTGTIVRSIVVINSGGKTRLVSILQGLWLLLTLLIFVGLVQYLPLATLAAILVFVSFKLINIKEFRRIYRESLSEFIVGISTFFAVVLTNIFEGVILGIVLSSVKLLYDLSAFESEYIHLEDGSVEFKLRGSLNFINLPKLNRLLKGIPEKQKVIFNLENLSYIDHSCFDALVNWDKQYSQAGGIVIIEWNNLETIFKFGKNS